MKPAQRILGGRSKRRKKSAPKKRKGTKTTIKIKGTPDGVKTAMKKILGGDSAAPLNRPI